MKKFIQRKILKFIIWYLKKYYPEGIEYNFDGLLSTNWRWTKEFEDML